MKPWHQRDGRGSLRHDRWQSPTVRGYFLVIDRQPVLRAPGAGFRPHWSVSLRVQRDNAIYAVAEIGMAPFTVKP